MRVPRTYIVRIYRQGYRSLTGSVEDAERMGVRSFSNMRQLGLLLRAPIEPQGDLPDETRPIDPTFKGG